MINQMFTFHCPGLQTDHQNFLQGCMPPLMPPPEPQPRFPEKVPRSATGVYDVPVGDSEEAQQLR